MKQNVPITQLLFLIMTETSKQNKRSQFTSISQQQYDMMIISMTPCLFCQPTPTKIKEPHSHTTQVHTESRLY